MRKRKFRNIEPKNKVHVIVSFVLICFKYSNFPSIKCADRNRFLFITLHHVIPKPPAQVGEGCDEMQHSNLSVLCVLKTI